MAFSATLLNLFPNSTIVQNYFVYGSFTGATFASGPKTAVTAGSIELKIENSSGVVIKTIVCNQAPGMPMFSVLVSNILTLVPNAKFTVQYRAGAGVETGATVSNVGIVPQNYVTVPIGLIFAVPASVVAADCFKTAAVPDDEVDADFTTTGLFSNAAAGINVYSRVKVLSGATVHDVPAKGPGHPVRLGGDGRSWDLPTHHDLSGHRGKPAALILTVPRQENHETKLYVYSRPQLMRVKSAAKD